jgi:hypothetical protein
MRFQVCIISRWYILTNVCWIHWNCCVVFVLQSKHSDFITNNSSNIIMALERYCEFTVFLDGLHLPVFTWNKWSYDHGRVSLNFYVSFDYTLNVLLRGETGTCHHTCVEVREQLRGLSPLLESEGFREWTQDIRLDSMCFYPLTSHSPDYTSQQVFSYLSILHTYIHCILITRPSHSY